MHEYIPIELPIELADPSQVARVLLTANISYWVSTVDEEY